MKKPLVTKLEDYKWSNYRAFIGKDKHVNWLNQQFTYDILGLKHKYKAYKSFVLQGTDVETENFFSGKQTSSVKPNLNIGFLIKYLGRKILP